MRIIIIEAIGKLKTVEYASKQRWGKNISVLATGGYIWTFPNNTIGIDPDTLRPNADKKTKNGQYFEQALTKIVAAYQNQIDDVILMTDPDREGEGIAAQAQSLIKKYLPQVKMTRLYAHELNYEGLRTAQVAPHLHEGIVQAQTARRVLDRLLPLSAAHQLHRDGEFMGLGRVQVATTRIIKDKSRHWKKYLLQGFWKTPKGNFFVREYDDDPAKLQDKLNALKTMKFSDASLQTKKLSLPPPPAHSGQSLLAGMLSARPENTMNAMQTAYMEGRMSYPRTDQTQLGAQATRTVAALMQNLHLGHMLRAQWHETNGSPSMGPGIQGAHSALHPTLTWAPLPGKPIELQEQVETEVAARAMASLMAPAELTRTIASIITDDGQWFDAVQDKFDSPGWTLAYERLGLQNPLSPKAELGKKYPKVIEQLPTPAHIIEWLNDEHMGRPGTLAPIPTKMQSLNLISAACVTTRFADLQLLEIEKIMPHYTYAAFTRFMENGLALLVEEPTKYLDVVKSILVEAGSDVVSLPSAIAKAKPVSLDDPEMSPEQSQPGFEF
jgi:DNA topoisomerase IA